MAITKEQKKQILKKLNDRFSRMAGAVFADYRGISVKDFQELRGKLREKGLDAQVAKKTLIKLAADQNNVQDFDVKQIEGPIVTAFDYEDGIQACKIMKDFSKEHEKIEIIAGIIEGKMISKDIVLKYAALPSKEELLAKVVGSMKSPISGFVNVLQGPLRGFFNVINALKEQKS